jgi:hypothetical protein
MGVYTKNKDITHANVVMNFKKMKRKAFFL